MELIIRNTTNQPIYDQIYSQIKAQIIAGKLSPGEALPSIRALAKDLRISVITTKRAYDELEADGFLYTVAGKGCFVAEKNLDLIREQKLKELGVNLDADRKVKTLTVSELQLLEITKAVSYDSKVVIMDEPTSSLTVAETQHLFKIIDKLRKEGRSIIYISHKLEEIFEIADEITVMRDGQYIGTWDIKDITIDQLIGQMGGRKMNERFPVCEDARTDEVMLQVKNFTSADPRSFKNVSFDLHKGEILGIGGLVGAQRTELIEAIFGLRRIVSGELTVNGKTVVNHSPQDAIRNGFALLTEERRATGIIPMSVWDNALAVAYKKLTGNVFGYIHTKKLSPSVDKVCTDLDVRMAGTKTLIKNLSGGNQQKVLIGRWLLANCDVIMLDEPTRGVDVGAKYEIYRIMQDLVKKGKAIIMVSSEMPELLGMSDRIMIMCAGKQTGILGKTEATQVEVMKYATQFEDKTKEGVSV